MSKKNHCCKRRNNRWKQPNVERMQYSVGGRNPLGSMGWFKLGSVLYRLRPETKQLYRMKEKLIEGLRKEFRYGDLE